MSKPIVTDEEIDQLLNRWNTTARTDMYDLVALVRRRLAERLRSEDTDQTRTDIHVGCLLACARIVESDE